MRFHTSVVALGVVVRHTQAVFVATNSPCATNCGNVLTGDSLDQIVCDDPQYTSASAGQVFKSCVTCESTSTYTITVGGQTQSDLGAMLYNMRYNSLQCIFNLESGPCSTSRACEPFQDALQYGNLTTSTDPYGYCGIWGSSDFFSKCTNCLLAEGHTVARNFISVLDGACTALVQPGGTIPLDGNIFSTTLVNVTSPSATAAIHPHDKVGPLTYGALAGVVIGGIAILLIFVGCGVVLNGKRRRQRYLRRREEQMQNWPTPQVGGGGEMFETPISQKPLRGHGWADSPMSAATTDGTFSNVQHFSPYHSQYNSPISAVEGGPGWMNWQQEKAHTIGMAISPDNDTPHPWSDHKGKEREEQDMSSDPNAFEMQHRSNMADGEEPPLSPPLQVYNPPLLRHPGPGRYTDLPMSSMSPSEAEWRTQRTGESGPA